ncbi:UDP-N-acetylmuramate dehydrogenase [Stutzerimonas zhaodongensis]|uniref:UDP-N-acetylmuramate dehydrogenase n=1 Tax=Stutzerimonas TaxID=2901164 RepID=UPI003890685A
MKSLTELEDHLDKLRIFYLKDFELKYRTYFKRGGVVKFYIKPATLEQFVSLVSFCCEANVEYRVFGGTTNTLFFDNIVYSVIISTENINYFVLSDTQIEVGAGYSLGDLVRVCLVNSLTGCEGLEGVPGTVGGAIFMNAGAYGYSISDRLVSVKCIDDAGHVVMLSKEQCGFAYRRSLFRTNPELIIISAIFDFDKGIQEDIAHNIETYHIARHLYQEWAYPNLGSMISLNKDIYLQIFRKNIWYTLYCLILKVFKKNPISKFFHRRRPNNYVFNKLALKFAGRNFSSRRLEQGRYHLSKKSANILINSGQYSDADFVKHILDISELAGSFDIIENEPVFYPSIKISDELKELSRIFEEEKV